MPGSDRRSRTSRKHSKAESYNSLPPQPEPERYYEQAAKPETWPPPSFLFSINTLPVNDEPSEGGEPPRVNENGRWYPPIRRNGFGPQIPGEQLYRWAEGGKISLADDCQLYEGMWWSRDSVPLAEYRASTMFYCSDFTQFLVATGDASMRHMDEAEDPHNRWWPLTFRHDGSLSQVEEVGQEQNLAGTGPWVNALGLRSYRNRRTSASSGGLAGNVAVIIGLIAFSCKSEDLRTVLLTDRAWHRGRWRGHSREDGRIDERGVVVTIYIDPENDQGSISETIYELEWGGGALLS
ncbi:uncharacterized protein PAC_06384 [Phialocephala subalpina]|uniref:Uncharacterized protein n=1 Tax=Phialocephala subalpina TaxID=576137 RepID=A0A1L7WUN5_9HELO|nr:uncharacterized protein PAC_06384 [Phialocephala subalpina]